MEIEKIQRKLSEENNASYFLGIDWGQQRCGIALADDETRLAFSWKTVMQKSFNKELDMLLDKFLVQKVIIGYFFSEGLSDKFKKNNQLAIKKIAEEIEKRNIKVEFQEEAFSTLLAKNNLWQAKKNAKENDAEAARIILQSWLDKQADKC